MTYVVEAIYYPQIALKPMDIGYSEGKTLEETMAALMDDVREFMRDEEETSWWEDTTITVLHDHVKTNYPFEYWAKHFGWSY